MKNFVLAVALSLSATSAMADDCADVTRLVGENWETITTYVNICADPNVTPELKRKSWRNAQEVFDLLVRTGNLCMRVCGSYPENREFCQESNSEVPGYRSDMYSICN